MNRGARTRRKFVYLAIIVVMLVPLYLLGQPATGSASNRSTGGQLAEMRQSYNLSSGDIGEIELTGESMRLATLGLRGVAATMLWQKSHKYERRKEWDRLSATLQQIARLQPHFEKVWEHQAHNLSYNVSVEFDDYRQRYSWVKKGTDFLMRGVRRNHRAPRLVWYTGWFFGNKLGMADEKAQFRRLFADDEPFHQQLIAEGLDVDGFDARGPYGKPDNWLVGRLWMLRAYELVDSGVQLRRKNPLNFFQDAALWRSQHAITIEDEGVLNDYAEDAWLKASADWNDYGDRPLPTLDGYTVRLGHLAAAQRQVEELRQQLEDLAGKHREEARQQRMAELPAEVQAAIAKPDEERDGEEYRLVQEHLQKIEPSYRDLIAHLPSEKRLIGMELIGRLEQAERVEDKIGDYRTQTNFVYWVRRAEAEREEKTIRARRLVYEAEQLLDEAELDAALEKFDQAWELWAEIFERYPILAVDAESTDLVMAIQRYLRLLDQEELPEGFPLQAFMEMQSESAMDPDVYLQRHAELIEQRELEAARQADQAQDEPQPDADTGTTDGVESEPASASDTDAVEAAEEPQTEATAAEPAQAENPADARNGDAEAADGSEDVGAPGDAAEDGSSDATED